MSRAGWGGRLRVALLAAASALFMTAGALVMLAVAALTLFRARRLYSEVFAAALGRAVLRFWGIRVAVHHDAALPAGQAVYISNHSSTIDIFAIIALGLPRTRYFMSGHLRRIVPLGIVGSLIRIFWTVPQTFPEERRRIFRRADGILRETGDSVFLSPEGMRVTTGEIGHFNKGAFHLATSLRAPIVPLYVRIPPAIDPGRGLDARPGTVEVFVLPPIDTGGWRLEELERNRDAVREHYVRLHARLRAPRTSLAAAPAAAPAAVPTPTAG